MQKRDEDEGGVSIYCSMGVSKNFTITIGDWGPIYIYRVTGRNRSPNVNSATIQISNLMISRPTVTPPIQIRIDSIGPAGASLAYRGASQYNITGSPAPGDSSVRPRVLITLDHVSRSPSSKKDSIRQAVDMDNICNDCISCCEFVMFEQHYIYIAIKIRIKDMRISLRLIVI